MSAFLREKLQEKGLKVTPQRVAIYEAIVQLENHPTAENVIEYAGALTFDVSGQPHRITPLLLVTGA